MTELHRSTWGIVSNKMQNWKENWNDPHSLLPAKFQAILEKLKPFSRFHSRGQASRNSSDWAFHLCQEIPSPDGVPQSPCLPFQHRDNPAVTVALSVQTHAGCQNLIGKGSQTGPLVLQNAVNGRKTQRSRGAYFGGLTTSMSSQLRHLFSFSHSSFQDPLIFPLQQARFSNKITKKIT